MAELGDDVDAVTRIEVVPSSRKRTTVDLDAVLNSLMSHPVQLTQMRLRDGRPAHQRVLQAEGKRKPAWCVGALLQLHDVIPKYSAVFNEMCDLAPC